jgi:hypothetical protein
MVSSVIHPGGSAGSILRARQLGEDMASFAVACALAAFLATALSQPIQTSEVYQEWATYIRPTNGSTNCYNGFCSTVGRASFTSVIVDAGRRDGRIARRVLTRVLQLEIPMRVARSRAHLTVHRRPR